MKVPDKQLRFGWRQEVSLFLGSILINVLLVIGLILVCIWFPFGWAYKKCRAKLKRPATDEMKHMLPVYLSLLLAACTCPEEVRTWTFPSMVECLKGIRLDSGARIASITTETSNEMAGTLTNGAVFSCTEVPIHGAAPRYQAYYSAEMPGPFSSSEVGPGSRGAADSTIADTLRPRRAT